MRPTRTSLKASPALRSTPQCCAAAAGTAMQSPRARCFTTPAARRLIRRAYDALHGRGRFPINRWPSLRIGLAFPKSQADWHQAKTDFAAPSVDHELERRRLCGREVFRPRSLENSG